MDSPFNFFQNKPISKRLNIVDYMERREIVCFAECERAIFTDKVSLTIFKRIVNKIH